MHRWFNQIAELIAYLIEQIEKSPHLKEYGECLDEEQDSASMEQAHRILQENKPYLTELSFDKKVQGLCCIIKSVKRCGDFYVGRHVLAQLDQEIPWRTIADTYDKPFEALNSNMEQTGILVLPRAPVLVPVQQDRPMKPADRFYPLLEDTLANLYFISAAKLQLDGKPYRIQNVICYPDMDVQACKRFRVVYSPLFSKKAEELLEIEYGKLKMDRYEYNSFTVNGVKAVYEKCIEQLYGRLLNYAYRVKADLVCSCEMLGIKSLYDTDDLGYNDVICNWLQEMDCADVPKFIIPPTYSYGGRNSLRVFDESGKLLVTQDKQYPFHYKHDRKKWSENLTACEPIVWILHIPDWGRMVFPICRDFIEPLYRELLIRDLKATIVICPSFSAGSRDFERNLATTRPFGANVFWGNTCLQAEQNWSGFVGAAENSSIGEHDGAKRLKPDCTGCCGENCVFIVDFPLDYAGENRHEDLGIEVRCQRIQ